MLPTALVTGLSGAGKTQVCEWLAQDGFLHLDGDVREANGIDRLGIRSEWNQFWNRGEPQRLAMALRARARKVGAHGALLSLPSTAVFTVERVARTRAIDLRLIVLFGTPQNCIRAFLEREKKMPGPMGDADWHRNNDHVYEQYVNSAFDSVRIEAFRPDGLRWSRKEIVKMILERLA